MKTYYKEIDGKKEFFKGNVLYTDDATVVNPSHEQMLAAGWTEWVAPEPTSEELLARAKATKVAEIDDHDAEHEVFIIGGQQMWLGHELRQQLKTSVEAYIATGAESVTKWFNGQEFTFPCQTWLQMLAVLEVYASDVLNATERHKAAVMAMDSVEAVEQYDITEGYPATVEFTPQRLAQMSGGSES